MPLTLAQQEPFLGSGVAQATRFFISFLAQHRTARAVLLPRQPDNKNVPTNPQQFGKC